MKTPGPLAPLARLLPLLALLILSFASSGCSLIGAGVGAAVPRYSERPTSAAQPGDDVRVVASDGERFSGTVTADARNVEVASDARSSANATSAATAPRLMPLEEMSHFKRRVGTYALRGFAIGAAIDGTVLVALSFLAMAAHSYGMGFGAMGGM